MISNHALTEAIKTGRQGGNCEASYTQCNLNPNNLEKFSKKIMQFATIKK